MAIQAQLIQIKFLIKTSKSYFFIIFEKSSGKKKKVFGEKGCRKSEKKIGRKGGRFVGLLSY